jgi:hypothetical protein
MAGTGIACTGRPFTLGQSSATHLQAMRRAVTAFRAFSKLTQLTASEPLTFREGSSRFLKIFYPLLQSKRRP